MRILIIAKAGYSNPRRDIEVPTGGMVDVRDDLAVKLLNRGIAVPAPAPKVETAEVAPPENAAKRTAKPKPKASRSSRPAKEEAEA